jgi:hypothetical protein
MLDPIATLSTCPTLRERYKLEVATALSCRSTQLSRTMRMVADPAPIEKPAAGHLV